MQSDVTVVIPVYDRAHLAEEAIASALGQEPRPAVVVVDDHGKRPFTPQTLAWAESGVVRIVGDRNRGLPAARNLGARHAETPFLLFLDDDDRLAPAALAALRAALAADPTAVAAGGGRRRFDADSVDERVGWPRDLSTGIAEAVAACPFSTPGQVLLRRQAFEAIGGFVEDVPLAEDWDLYVRLLTIGPILTPPVHVVDYRRHAESMSATSKVGHLSVALCDHYRRRPPAPEVTANLDRMVASLVDAFLLRLLWHGGRHLKAGQIGPAWRELSVARRLTVQAVQSAEGRAALRKARHDFRS